MKGLKMPKAKPSKQDAAKAAITAKLDAVAQDAEAATAHARWLTGSALDMARPLPDDLRNAVAALVEESRDLAADKVTIRENERGICNSIAAKFFEHTAHGGDPATLNTDICLSFNWPLVTHMACGKEIKIEGSEKKPATFGQVMSKISKVWAADGSLPRLYSSKDRDELTIVKRYSQIKAAEVTSDEHIEKGQKATGNAINKHIGKLTPPQLKARMDEAKRQYDQFAEMYKLVG
jgi:hypothetical protein